MTVDVASSVRRMFVGKHSGIGRVGGRFALEQMTDMKTIVIEVDGG